MDIKKSVGIDTLPPTLIKISTGIIAKSLMTAIKYLFNSRYFSQNAKIASISPLHEGKPNKHGISK